MMSAKNGGLHTPSSPYQPKSEIGLYPSPTCHKNLKMANPPPPLLRNHILLQKNFLSNKVHFFERNLWFRNNFNTCKAINKKKKKSWDKTWVKTYHAQWWSVNIWPILHVYSDLVIRIRKYLTPPPPLVRKNQKLPTPFPDMQFVTDARLLSV